MTSIEVRWDAVKRPAIRRHIVQIYHKWAEHRRRTKERRAIAHLSDRMLRDIGADKHIQVNPDKSPSGSWFLALSRFQP